MNTINYSIKNMDDKRIRQLNRSYNMMLNAFADQPISNYYNLDPDITITLLKINDDLLRVVFDYENTPPLITQMPIPSDIQRYIQSFLHQKYKIASQVYYPREYPFRSPIWTLIDTTISIIEIDKQFKFFNRQLHDSWLPCTNMQHDILCYLVWIRGLI